MSQSLQNRRFAKSMSRAPRDGGPHYRRLRCEILEDRRLLSIAFPDFSTPTGLNLVGDASITGDDVLRLTPALNSQSGGAWFSEKQLVSSDFETTFDFRLTGPGGEPGGSDGFAVVFQNQSVSTLMGGGGNLGYGGIPNSLAVEFDIFRNSENQDTSESEVSIHTNGTGPNDQSELYSLGSFSTVGFILDDGNVHTAKVAYTPGTMRVYLDDLVTPALTVSVDLDTLLDLDLGRAWVGFTGASGGDPTNHDILNWHLTSAADTNPVIAIGDAEVMEGRSGSTQGLHFPVTVTRPDATDPLTVEVTYATVDGTATSSSGDYIPAEGTLTYQLAVGESTSTQIASVSVNGDDEVEADETFAVELSNAVGAIVVTTSGIGTILNDEAPVIPNDPLFAEQWALDNRGQTGGAWDADIDAPAAWSVTTGSAATVVAMLDTGIDYTHEDLYLNVWVNQGEIPAALRPQIVDSDANSVITLHDLNHPANASRVTDWNGNGRIDGGDLLADPAWEDGIDTDGNGYTDDLIGWDWVNNDNDPMDENGHGTTTAGVLGAVGHNGVGTAGVNWRVQMMALRFEPANYAWTDEAAAGAIDYAVAMGATISSNSWGTGLDAVDDYPLVRNAIEHAGQAGHLFVSSAGNFSSSIDPGFMARYPAGYAFDNILSVAATDHDDVLADFSDWGAVNVDLAAPGKNVLRPAKGDAYGLGSGTSFATPHVAGVAALLKTLHPGWGATELKQRIMDTVDPLPSLAGKTVTGGRLNAARAVAETTITVDDPSVLEGSSGTTSLAFTVTRAGDATGSVTVSWSTSDGTAAAGSDYVAASGEVTFLPGGVNTQTISVTIQGDTAQEGNETFFVDFEVVLGDALLADREGQATILNDDAEIVIDDIAVLENDRSSFFVDAFVPAGPTAPSRPRSLSFGPDGNLYVVSENTDELLRYDATTGELIGAFVAAQSGGLDRPFAHRFGPDGNLYIASFNTDEILRYHGTTGAFIDVFVSAGSGGLDGPAELLFGSNGDLYVANNTNSSVLRYNGTTGAFVGVFVASGSGGLAAPRGMEFGPDGHLYVAGSSSGNILRYDRTSGALLDVFVPSGSGGLSGPGWIMFHGDGSLYVTDWRNDLVNRYNAATGAFVDTSISAHSGGFDAPAGFAFGNDGLLYVASMNTNEILRYGFRPEAELTVSLSTPVAQTVTVDYATADGTATAPADYVATAGTITFLPGETAHTIIVPIVDDSEPEGDETFVVNLSNPSGGATIVDPQGMVTIEHLLAVVSHWPADGTAADAVGDNDATLVNGAGYTLGQIGQAFLFDGVDDRAFVADHPSLALTDSMTIEAWIRADSFPDPEEGTGWIVFRGDDRGGLDPYKMGVQSDRSLKFEINGAPGAAAISTPIPQGEILHVAATLDDATGDMSIYVNGVQMGHTITNVRPFADLDPASNPGIGIGISRFHGMIDELKIHNVALSEPGILGIYNAGKGDLQAEISINDVSVTEGDSGVQLVDDFVTPPAGDLHEARTIAFGPQGDLFVASSFPPQVLRYDGATGAYVGVFADAQDGGPDQRTGSLVFDANYLYVSNAGANSILRFDAATGDPAPAPGQAGAVFVPSGFGYTDGPYGMALGPDGNLYVSNLRRDNITRFDISTGAFLGVFVTLGSGGLDQPAGLLFDDAGRLCVVSSGTDEILRYQGPNGSSPGAYLDVLIPSQSGGLDLPNSMVVGPEGDLYVNSRDSNQVLRYDMETGAFLESIAVARPGSLLAPKGITFDANGVLYVTSSAGEQVLRSAPKSHAVVHVELSMPVPETVTVNFTTAGGTASAGNDYAATGGTLTFPPGVTSRTIIVPTIDDLAPENSETFFVNLSGATGGATIADSQALATILDTDTHKAWTFLVYLDGDNDLESAGIGDFLEMASVGSGDDVNIVLQFDRIPGEDSRYGDWTDTRRGLVMPGDVPDATWGTNIGEADMGDPNTLSEFVNWAIAMYPADHYALVLWNHGGGWRSATTGEKGKVSLVKGICWDDTNGTYLENREVREALADVPQNLDLVGYDACLMAMLEVAHEVKDEADVFVSSEQTEPGDGWPYHTILADLVANPTWTALDLGADIAFRYDESYGGWETQSAIDLSAVADPVAGLSAAVSDLADEIMAVADYGDFLQLQTHRDDSAFFTDTEFRDLGTFLAAVAADAETTAGIRGAAQAALDAYDLAVIANYGEAQGGTGISIYFQEARSAYDPAYTEIIIDFARDTSWDDFLTWWGGPHTAPPVEIHGMKWNDLNGNGVKDGGEPGLPDWTIYLDLNGNGLLDGGAGTFPSTDVPKPITDFSTVTSTLTVSGVGAIFDVDVTLDITHTFDSDLEVFLISPGGTRVELFSDVGDWGEDFTDTTLDDEAAMPITSAAAPFTGRFRPVGALAALDGEDADGLWTLEIYDAWAGDEGTLNSWSLALNPPDPSFQTLADGSYHFTDLAPGTYTVAEVQQSGWQQTAPQPVSPGTYSEFVDWGDIITGWDFGNREIFPDFGDAPDTGPGTGSGNYNTLSTDNGPSHVIVPTIFMGATVDGEAEAIQSPSAEGDDSSGTPDDEDGLVDPAGDLSLVVGTAPEVRVIVTNNSGASAILHGWIDYNGDGVFSNATEYGSVSVAAGTTAVTLTLPFPAVPAGSVATTYARFRLSTDSAAGQPTGGAIDGEVEDYAVTIEARSTTVVGRHVFYNNSYFDGYDSAANAADDNAIAPAPSVQGHGHPADLNELDKELGKQALLPGQTASFVNYTSYDKGINGIMIDFDGLPGTPTAADFSFRVGNNNNPDGWQQAPAPQVVAIRSIGEIDRVTLIWADDDWTTPAREAGSISKQWLQVIVLATANTGLLEPDVFYFGNAIGEGGDKYGSTPSNAYVNATDEIGARRHPHAYGNVAAIYDPYDFNRTTRVDATDQIIARRHVTGYGSALSLITAPAVQSGQSAGSAAEATKGGVPVVLVAEVFAPAPAEVSVDLGADSQGAPVAASYVAEAEPVSLVAPAAESLPLPNAAIRAAEVDEAVRGHEVLSMARLGMVWLDDLARDARPSVAKKKHLETIDEAWAEMSLWLDEP